MKRILIIMVAMVFFVQLFGHAASVGGKDAAVEENDGKNITLYVSNKSVALKTVDIEVYFDGELKVSDDFTLGKEHGWRKFMIELTDGEHELKAVSKKGGAEIKKKLVINGKHWTVLKYDYAPERNIERCFEFKISGKSDK